METRRHELTKSQAIALAEIEAARRRAIYEWNKALLFVGVAPEDIVGGNLDDDPHFIVKVDAPTA